jgi:hypothetical protein
MEDVVYKEIVMFKEVMDYLEDKLPGWEFNMYSLPNDVPVNRRQVLIPIYEECPRPKMVREVFLPTVQEIAARAECSFVVNRDEYLATTVQYETVKYLSRTQTADGRIWAHLITDGIQRLQSYGQIQKMLESVSKPVTTPEQKALKEIGETLAAPIKEALGIGEKK